MSLKLFVYIFRMLPYFITSLTKRQESSTYLIWLVITPAYRFMPWTYPTSGSLTDSIFNTHFKLSVIEVFYERLGWQRVSFGFGIILSGNERPISFSICQSIFEIYLAFKTIVFNFYVYVMSRGYIISLFFHFCFIVQFASEHSFLLLLTHEVTKTMFFIFFLIAFLFSSSKFNVGNQFPKLNLGMDKWSKQEIFIQFFSVLNYDQRLSDETDMLLGFSLVEMEERSQLVEAADLSALEIERVSSSSLLFGLSRCVIIEFFYSQSSGYICCGLNNLIVFFMQYFVIYNNKYRLTNHFLTIIIQKSN